MFYAVQLLICRCVKCNIRVYVIFLVFSHFKCKTFVYRSVCIKFSLTWINFVQIFCSTSLSLSLFLCMPDIFFVIASFRNFCWEKVAFTYCHNRTHKNPVRDKMLERIYSFTISTICIYVCLAVQRALMSVKCEHTVRQNIVCKKI